MAPTLKLYYMPVSPPSRFVLITAHLLNLELELITVDLLAGEQLKPEFIKLNPQHTIPLLVDGKAIIYDSHAICAYLVEKYGAEQQQLYPKDLVQRAQVDARLHLDSGVLFGRAQILFHHIQQFGQKEQYAQRVESVQRAWPLLEAFLESGPYLCGQQLTLADVACISSVNSVHHIATIDEQKYPKLSQWMTRLAKELPHYERDCAAPGLQLQQYAQSLCQ